MADRGFRASVIPLKDGSVQASHVEVLSHDGSAVTSFEVEGDREQVEHRIKQAGYGLVAWDGNTARLHKVPRSTAERVANSFLIQFLIVIAVALVILLVSAVAGSGAQALPQPHIGFLGAALEQTIELPL